MSAPHVIGIFVGFYKNHDFVEFDCPWCGRIHTAKVENETTEYPVNVVVLCKEKPVTISALTIPAVTCENEEDE